jgi:hypothetical protein
MKFAHRTLLTLMSAHFKTASKGATPKGNSAINLFWAFQARFNFKLLKAC